MDRLLTLLRILRGLISFTSLFAFILSINVIQVLSVLIFPLSQKVFRRINTFLAGSWWSTAEWVMQKSGIDVALSGDSIPEGENIILISNHQGISDIPVLFKLAKKGKQIGHMKWFIKDVVKYVPGVGWGMLFVDGLFVKRNWFKDKQKIESTFKKFFDHNIPIWLMIFPEGTRFKADKLKLMARIAKSKKLPPLTHVLLPRSKGFVASVQGLRGHCQAIYDVTIIYEEESPSIADLILGKVTKVHVHVKRFEISQLSDDKDDLNNWITERFYIKNEMIAKHQVKKASEVLN